MGGFGGGGGGKKSKSAPPQAQSLDVGAMMGAATAAAREQIKAQYEELIKNYPKLEELSFGTVQKLADRLGGEAKPIYEQKPIYAAAPGRAGKRGEQIITGYEKVQSGTTDPNLQTRDALARIRQALELGDMDPNAAMPTSIEQGLYDAGERELALGRSLSAEQQRDATQSARVAMAARGLGMSMPAVATEILNRDAAASARERERQAFASQQNTMMMGNVMGRRGALADLYMAGAGNLIAADPYQRAVAPGLGLGQGTQGNMMQMSGQTFSSANQLAGQAALANAQMQEGRYNSWANSNAALQAARMQAGASNQAGMFGLIGGIGGGALAGVGFAI